jgi:hypothetical protein
MPVTPVLTLAALAVAAPAALGAGTTLFQDNFDSYADQSALLSAYNGPGSTGSPAPSAMFNLGVPDPDAGNTTQAVNYHDMPGSGTGVSVLDHTFQSFSDANAIKPSDETPIVWSFDFYWDGLGNKRVSSGLRSIDGAGAASYVLEMGYYNSAYNPITAAGGSGFAVRTVLVPGSGGLPESAALQSWRLMTTTDNSALLGSIVEAPAWMTFSATIKSHSIDYAIDVNRDGTIDSTYTAMISDPNATQLDLTNAIFTDVRLGGPSGLSSAGGGAFFDNINIATAPSAPVHNPGDTNNDGVVDLTDLNNVLNNFGSTGTGNPGDDDSSGVVDLTDLNNVLNNFGTTYAAAALNVVPEPASLSLLGLGAAAFLARRRRA